jgi:hypothetical protein
MDSTGEGLSNDDARHIEIDEEGHRKNEKI